MSANDGLFNRGLEKLRLRILMHPLWMALWPVVRGAKLAHRHFLSYLFGHVVREGQRVRRIKFIWYADSVYLHPMIWGSALLFFLAHAGWVSGGWLLLAWFIALVTCYVTIVYNFDVVKASILGTAIVALLGAAYFSTVEWRWNPFTALAGHVQWLDAGVTPGFFLASSYVFFALIICEVIWAWLFHRVEIDESYVYEHECLQGTTREPIFARSLKRETKDLLELLILGAADIQHRTRSGSKRFKNVPFASLWLGTAIDDLLDTHRTSDAALEKKHEDDAEQVRTVDVHLEEAMAEESDSADEDSGEEDDSI